MGDVNHEPTMEEILASIKKIIAEDGEVADSGKDARSRRRRPETFVAEETGKEEAGQDDVLELTDQVEAEPADTVASDPLASDPAMAEVDSEPEELVSDETAHTSQVALAALSAIASGRPIDGGEAGDAHPLEGLVRDMLRPMLKEWLDANLPAMVEEMVAREIARIAAGRE